MANFKTNIIKPFKKQGGTFCTFASAMEDIGLNINEKSNKVRLSHYAILNIPDCDYTNQNPNKNVLNLLSSPDAFHKNSNNSSTGEIDEIDGSENFYVRRNIAQSFMSYALNMEAVIRNNNSKYSYDFTRNLTIAERVFWKWLKESGAINWQRVDGTSYYKEMDENDSYKKVVQSFGNIDAVAQRSSDYGMYNEVYVNIPTSFGGIENIYFKQVDDDNYSFGREYKTNDINNLEKHSKDVSNALLSCVPFFDYRTSMEETNITHKIDGEEGYWFGKITTTQGENAGYYITDAKVVDLDEELYNTIEVNDGSINYTINRSKLDCMTLELNLNNLNANTYDELNINTDINNYPFNTILIYYSIYDNNDNLLSTNLYGVYFIDSVVQIGEANNNDNFINFGIPRLTKKKSTIEGFGTSYSFRFNIRTSSLFEGENDIIYDNASSENSIVNDFNDVVADLNTTLNLLNKYTKYTFILQERYNTLNKKYEDLNKNINSLTQIVNELKNKKG